jgi:thymidylate synthase
MKHFKGKTFAQVYKESLISLSDNFMYETSPRGQKVKEDINVTLEIEDPTQCFFVNERRSTQFKYIAAELIWYYTGQNTTEWIGKYAKMWDSIKNEDGTVNSAYGNLIFNIKNEHGLSQYEWAITSLINDKNTRQAVLHFNMPVHQFETNKDFVCTMYANFHIRDEKLFLTVHMRSNDAILGTPTDVPFFCSLQMQMLEHLLAFYPNLKLGSYTHIANSYHVYERHYDMVKEIINGEVTPQTMPPVKSDLVFSNGKPTPELLWVKGLVDNTEKDKVIFQDRDDLLFWITSQLIAHDRFK